MRCGDLTELMHGYLDRELDLGRSLEVEEHLKECAGCSQVYGEHQKLHSALSSRTLYFEAPAKLRKSVRAAVREAGRAEARPVFWSMPWLRVLVPVALTALVVALALIFIQPSAREGDPVSRQIVAAQVQSIKEDHLTEVASADQSVVQSWFYKKLGFGAPAVDLSNHEFPLLGGRVEKIDNQSVAVVVFHYQKEPIGLYVWPLKGAAAVPEKNLRQEGHNLIHWTQAGLNCWAVSDIKRTDLRKFVRLVQELGYTPQGAPQGKGVGIYKYPQSQISSYRWE